MCGIAGILDLSGSIGRDRLLALGSAMNESIAHRGPDDQGVWIDGSGRCMLAQRRLAIVDLSPNGHQPMPGPGGGSAITYNGEIYNFPELRKRLEDRGEIFASHTDTEVVLRLLVSEDTACLSALRGMFAFAYFDATNGSLLLARDPFGKKPLYVAYDKTPGRSWFGFASELTALERIAELDRRIDPEALGDYLLLQYVLAPRSIYRGVRKIEPGTWMRVDAQGRVSQARYFAWSAQCASCATAKSYEERLAELDEMLQTAVRRRMISDVPLGAFLSGGVDSALVVAMMRRLGATPKTYSVGFANSPDSEHAAAREIADRLECDHHEILVQPDAIEMAPMIAASLDEPNGDSSCLPTFLLSRFTRRHVTVALSGDGGDEMFGGYGRYLDTIRESLAPPRGWSASTAYLGPRWTIFQSAQIAAFLGEVPESTAGLIAEWTAMLDDVRVPLVHRMRTLDANTYMPGAVLAKVDRMSMRFALEVRCPFLDVDVSAFASGLSEEDCLVRRASQLAGGKRMLKDLLARDLPREWVDRKKVGFGLPAGFWNGAALRDFAHDVLASPETRVTNHLNRDAVRAWLAAQEDARQFSIYRLWPMLILELWMRRNRERAVPLFCG